MSLNPTAAITDLLWLSSRLKGLLDLAPKLEELGGLENYEAELKTSIKALQADNESLANVKDNLLRDYAAAKKQTEDTINKAEAQAREILDTAKVSASAAREAARAELSAELSELAAQKKKKQKELADLSVAYDDKQKELVELQTAFDDMTAAIAELKARF